MKKSLTESTIVLIFLLIAFFVMSSAPVKASNDLWVERAPLPNAEMNFGAVSVNGEIYTIGSNFTYTFDPIADNWVSKKPMPTNQQGFAITAYQGNVYVIGGWSSTDPKTGLPAIIGSNEMYDTSNDTWTSKASIPIPTADMHANEVNGKIYLVSGVTNFLQPTVTTNTWVYDPSTDSWSSEASIPTPVFYYASSVIGDKVYIEGGESGNSPHYSNLNQFYDTQTNTWSSGEPFACCCS